MKQRTSTCLILPFVAMLTCLLSTTARVAESADYHLTPENAKVGFVLGATLHTVHGIAKKFSGVFRIPKELNPEEFTAKVTVSVSGMDTDNHRRDNKMRNVCFEMQKFPNILFRSTAFKEMPIPPWPDKGFVFNLVGDLTIKGVVKEITMPVKVSRAEKGWKFSGKVSLAYLKEFPIEDPSVFILRVAKEVEVFVEFVLPYNFPEREETQQ